MDRDALAEALASLTLVEASALVEALRARLGVAPPHAPAPAVLSYRGMMDFDAPRCAEVEVTSWGEDPLAVARVIRKWLVVPIAELAAVRRRASATFACTLTLDQASELRRALADAGAVAVVHLEALE